MSLILGEKGRTRRGKSQLGRINEWAAIFRKERKMEVKIQGKGEKPRDRKRGELSGGRGGKKRGEQKEEKKVRAVQREWK